MCLSINHGNTYMQTSIDATTGDSSQGPLPDCSFIATNQPIPRPAPLTTTTKRVKDIAKRKRAGKNTKEQAVKKTKASGMTTKAAQSQKPAE